MSGKYLLDTNIVIALFADEPILTAKLQKRKMFQFPLSLLESCFTARKNRADRKRISGGLTDSLRIM